MAFDITGWVDGRIKVVAAELKTAGQEVFSDERVAALATALQPTIEVTLRNLLPDIAEQMHQQLVEMMPNIENLIHVSAEHVIEDVGNNVDRVGDELSQNITDVSQHIGEDVASTTTKILEGIGGLFNNMIPPFLRGG